MGNWLPYLSLAASLVIGGATLTFARRQTATSEDGDARDEAISLAQLRAERNTELLRMNEELGSKITAVATKGAADQAALNVRIAELEHRLERQREEAEHAQNLLLAGFRAVLSKALRHLTADPPETVAAVAFLREQMGWSPEPPPYSTITS